MSRSNIFAFFYEIGLKMFIRKLIQLIIFSFISSSIYAAAELGTVNLGPNQAEFVVTLPANATTGFQWEIVSYDKNLFTLISSEYLPSNTNRIGAGGMMSFSFKINKLVSYPASSPIQFRYARSWEASTGRVTTINVNFSNSPVSAIRIHPIVHQRESARTANRLSSSRQSVIIH